MKKIASAVSIIIFFALLAAIILHFQQPARSEWLEGFKYRYPIIVEEKSGNRLNNYQIKIVLNSSIFDFSKVKPDGSDIRFADEKGRLYPYWIEKWPSPELPGEKKESIIWVKLDSLEPFEKKKIYLYYGNPEASSYSNLIQTMDFMEVISESISSEPTTLTFSFDHQLALPSPPLTSEPKALSVYVYKENNVFKACIRGSSQNPKPEGKFKVFFLGLNQGSYKLGDLNIFATTVTASSFSSDYFDMSPSSVLAPGNLTKNIYYLAGIFARPANDLQLGLLNPCFRKQLPYGGSITLLFESDNTTSGGLTPEIEFFRFETSKTVISAYEASRESPAEIVFSLITTDSTAISVGEMEAVFCSLGSALKGSVFSCMTSNNGLTFLRLLKDETAASSSLPDVNVSLIAFSRSGIYPVTKKVTPEPEVRLARIEGTVYEDKNLSTDYENGEDHVLGGVRVRLYEDKNNNGKIDTEDIFITETTTNDEGKFFFPALENNSYLITVSATSAGQTFISDNSTPYSLCPEEVSAVEYSEGNYHKLIRFGGEDPQITDYWSENPDPAFNVYEHYVSVKTGNEETIKGIDFGFSFELVVNTLDTDPPSQGSLRQAVINSNFLPGKQKIRFYFNGKDSRYSELLKEYLIELKKPLPAIIDTVEIDGTNVNKARSDSTIVLSGTAANLSNCFEVLAPGVKISNLKISGFKKGIVFSVPQYELTVRKKDFVSRMVPIKANSDPCKGYQAVNADDLSSLPLFEFSQLDHSTLTLVERPTTSTVFYLLGRLSKATTPSASSKSFYIEGGLAENKNLLAVSGNSKSLFKLENNYLEVPPLNATIVGSSKLQQFYEAKNLSLISAEGMKATSLKFSGFNFIVPLPAGFKMIAFSSFNTSASITKFYENYGQSSETTVLPYSFESPAQDSVVSLESSSAAQVFLNSSSNYLPIPYAANRLCGIFKDNFYLAASEDAEVTLFVSWAGSEKTFTKYIKAGFIYSLKDFGELNLNGNLAAVYVFASKPVGAFGVINEDGQTSFLPFLPQELLSTKFSTQLLGKKLILVSLAPAKITFEGGPNKSNFTLAGSFTSPALTEVDSLNGSFSVSSDRPIFACFKETLTGKYLLPESMIDNALLSSPLDIESKYAFDSQSLIEKVSFLSCIKGVVIAEGCGVELRQNHYLACEVPIDLSDNGNDPVDDSISSDLPNLGVDSPVITSAVVKDSSLTIAGYVGSPGSATFDEGEVEIYLADKSGQPNFYLGSASVAHGIFTLEKTIESFKLTPEDFVVAVFTFKDGSTSEFSIPTRIDPAPVIYDVKATHITPLSEEPTSTLVTTITWFTDIPSTSKVVYDEISHASTETYAYETTETTELVTTHTVVLNGLKPNTLYYFRVISRNQYGDTGISYEYMIPPGRTIPDTDLCAACHRAHTGSLKPLRLPYYVRE